MGRLFWKFFFFIWLAQLTAILGVSTTFWLERRAADKRMEDIDLSRPASFLVESAAATLQHGGTQALRSLLENMEQHQVYAVDERSQELLGRKVTPAAIEQARSILGQDANRHRVRQVKASDGHTYVLYVPVAEKRPESGRPLRPGDRPPPHRGGHILPFVPMAAAMLASLIFAALLAWYFSKPIRNLRSAFEAAAAGNLEARLGPVMGKRHDELADLGRDFDRMASRLRALMDGQRRLLHDVSHELRSPLARLQAAIGLARQQPEKLEASMERIERETVRMDKLVGELLTLSRLEAGVTGSMEEDINVRELVADIVADARFEAEANGRRVDFSGGGEAIVKGKTELLHGAIENVVRNAVKHTPEGGSVFVKTEPDVARREFRIAVLDEGTGVPETELSAIFEPFFRGGGTKSTDGHGLGLAIARRVIEAHGGAIRASNRIGGGLCVEIVLPYTRPRTLLP